MIPKHGNLTVNVFFFITVLAQTFTRIVANSLQRFTRKMENLHCCLAGVKFGCGEVKYLPAMTDN